MLVAAALAGARDGLSLLREEDDVLLAGVVRLIDEVHPDDVGPADFARLVLGLVVVAVVVRAFFEMTVLAEHSPVAFE